MSLSVVMIGATGAVGRCALTTLLEMSEVDRVTSLGRRTDEAQSHDKLTQHVVDLADETSFEQLLQGHDCAICTLGVGQPSKVTKEAFTRIDRDMPERFAGACKRADVSHFELLGSVGADAKSSSFYLRSKGQLEEALIALDFARLSLFHPSMILTPENRYGITQGITLAVWPKLHWAMRGRAQHYRGIEVDVLGRSMALNLVHDTDERVETLHWADFHERGRL